MMASLEFIHYSPQRPFVSLEGIVTWESDSACTPIKGLPQIFWSDGSPWHEANLWAYQRATGKSDIRTVQSNLSHLHKYADWLELENLDWRHFPMLEKDRVLFKWRKYLINNRDEYGLISSSTATQRMRATIQFYRFAKAYNLIDRNSPMWQEKISIHRFHDVHGFERTMLRPSTDLSIPNRARHGQRLEGGLTPLTLDQMRELLAFTAKPYNASQELHLILQMGFYSGARIETIADLKRGTLNNASYESSAPGLIFLPVGPNHVPYVATKHDVQGRLMVPDWLFQRLIDHISTTSRLKRESLAAPEHKDLIFLTRFGNPYASRENNRGTAIDRALVDLRRQANKMGMNFAKNFHFHQTRATFGTWLTSMLLEKGHNVKAVLSFVSNAMLHKEIETTFRYIKFVEQTKIKIEVANEFTNAFLGPDTRLGGKDA